MTTVLLVLALVPPIFLLIRVYQMDKIEKEPRGLIIKLFIFGALTTIPAAFIENIVINGLLSVMSPYSYLYMFIENFFCIALVEEGVKYLGLRLGSWKNPAFDYCFDGVVYAVTVSLGFAALENVLYVFSYGVETGILRAVTSIPGHCIFGIFMGYYYGMAKYGTVHGFTKKASTFKWLAVIMPMLLHGFYDFCASSGSELFTALFFGYVVILDIFAIRSIRQYSRGDTPIVENEAGSTQTGSDTSYYTPQDPGFSVRADDYPQADPFKVDTDMFKTDNDPFKADSNTDTRIDG